MIPGLDVDLELWQVLREEGLTTFSQFFQSGVFDEFPFYSLDSQVALLRGLPTEEANELLLNFALRFLNVLVNAGSPSGQYLAALTFWDHEESPFLVPNLFVCDGMVNRRLLGKLRLHEPKTPFSSTLRALLERTNASQRYTLLEDTETVPDMARAFLGFTKSPYPHFVPISSFKEVSPASRKRKA